MMEISNRLHDVTLREDNVGNIDDDEPLISASDHEDEVRIHSTPWQHGFGLIELVQVTYFVSGLSSLPIMEQYLYARFLGNNTGHVTMLKDQSTCEKNLTYSNNDGTSPEILAQQMTSMWMMIAMAFSFVPAMVTTYFWGVYSDLKGRKRPMICASFGAVTKYIILLAFVKWELPMTVFLIAGFVDGCTGFFGTMLMCVYSYIADTTKVGKPRSRRMMTLEVSNGICVALAQLGVGYFIRYTGFFYPILAITFLQLSNLIIIIFIVPETCKSISETAKVFTLNSIKRTIRVFTKRTPKGRRLTLVICIIAMACLDPALMTKRGVEVLYVLRSPLCWDPVKIGIFTSCSIIAQMIFTMLALRFLQGCFRDVVIAILGAVSCTANVMLEAFATTDAVMYLAAALGLLSFMSPPIIKGLMSEKISADEQGSMFSGLVSVQFLFQGAGILSLNAIYISTVAFMPGLVFLVIAAFSFLAIFLLGYLALNTNNVSRMRPRPSFSNMVH